MVRRVFVIKKEACSSSECNRTTKNTSIQRIIFFAYNVVYRVRVRIFVLGFFFYIVAWLFVDGQRTQKFCHPFQNTVRRLDRGSPYPIVVWMQFTYFACFPAKRHRQTLCDTPKHCVLVHVRMRFNSQIQPLDSTYISFYQHIFF